MVWIIAVIFGVMAILVAVLLVVLVLIGWFGLNGKVKDFVNKYLSRSFDREYRNPNQAAINTQCYICLQRVRQPAVATCNHGFCAKCIIQYVETKGGRQVECPACRQKICVLFRQFEPTNQQQRTLKHKIADYNFKNSQQPGIVRSIRQLPNIVRNAPTLLTRDGIQFLLTNPRVKVILVMLLYTLSPIDLLPQSFLGPFGLFDDGFAILNMFRQISGLMIDFSQEEAARNRQRNGNRDEERERLRA